MLEEANHVNIAPEPAVALQVEALLLSSLGENLPQAANEGLAFAARNRAGALVGGLAGSTSYGWLVVKLLWVAESHRGRGLGRRLMEVAESRATELDCHRAWPDTSNPEARRFYQELGYEVFAELENSQDDWPPSHHRWFMRKALRGG